MLGSHCVKSWSTTQNIALSSGEAELYGIVKAAAEALGMRSLLRDLGCEMSVTVKSDSSAAIGTCSRYGLGKLKHVDVRHLWIQEKVDKREIKLVKVKGTHNPADAMTKYLGRPEIDAALWRISVVRCTGRHDIAPEVDADEK